MKPKEIKVRFEMVRAALHQAAIPSETALELTAAVLFLKRATDVAADGARHSPLFAQYPELTDSLRGFSWSQLTSSDDTTRSVTNLLEIVESAVRPVLGLSSESALAQTLVGRHGRRAELVTAFTLVSEISLVDSTDREVSEGFQLLLDTPSRDAAAGATPATVRDLCASLIDLRQNARVYDPACGFASLLCDAARVFEAHGLQFKLVGQELMPSIAVLARLNAFLGGWRAAFFAGDTLRAPHHSIGEELGKFDVVVAHPPFGLRIPREVLSEDVFGRFGIASPATSESAFLQHADRSIAAGGCGVVLVPNGLLSRSGRDRNVRTQLVLNGRLVAVIGLPSHLFPGTAIPVSIMVLHGTVAAGKAKPVVFVDLSQSIEGPKTANRLTKQGIAAAIESVRSGAAVDGFSAVVERGMLENNAFDLSVGRYVKRVSAVNRRSFHEEIQTFRGALADLNAAESRVGAAMREMEIMIAQEKKDPGTH